MMSKAQEIRQRVSCPLTLNFLHAVQGKSEVLETPKPLTSDEWRVVVEWDKGSGFDRSERVAGSET